MKVFEKGTDRKVEIHFKIEGVDTPIDEYGEYIDTDGAVCCYVPVEAGNKIKLNSNFCGTAKSVRTYRSKSDLDKFLFQSGNDVREAELLVKAIASDIVPQENGKETIGTIEVELSVFRRFGDGHALRDIEMYYEVQDLGPELRETVGYKTVPPNLQITYDLSKAATLIKGTATRRHKLYGEKRPGSEAWAVFRFHYRTKQAILDANLPITYSVASDVKGEARELDIDEVPRLVVGDALKAKPADSEGSPSHQSTEAPSVPNTPVKNNSESNAMVSDLPPPLVVTAYYRFCTALNLKPKKALSGRPRSNSVTPALNKPLIPGQLETLGEELLKMFQPSPAQEGAPGMMVSTQQKPLSIASTSLFGDGSPNPKVPVAPKHLSGLPYPSDAHSNGVMHGVDSTEETKDIAGDKDDQIGENINVMPKSDGKNARNMENSNVVSEKPKESITNDTTGGSSTDTVMQSSNGYVNETTGSEAQKQLETFTKARTQRVVKHPTPINTTSAPMQKQHAVTSTKRAEDVTPPGSPLLKRSKLSPDPRSSPVLAGPPVPGTPTSQFPLERQLFEARKRLLQKKAERVKLASRQGDVDAKLVPHQQKMQEEIDRLNREAEKEERLMAEEEDRLRESEVMLAEFEGEREDGY
ncbi:hypothetical protein K469DRAFT_754436 [Zopfia rhizophila CBS 207.26]|uniref:Uncharacterized protein n=1 Tax=Zopfia rhizophila CBS 207.26 TaxID=1314779 RepID=A0A6A6DHJ9_9PEZI|nr:hypothetical protein K469DRAFT_754436 [Zopfia rhizophila CBS 207.26]